MNDVGSKTLITNRLILRKCTLEDAPMLFNNCSSDEKVTQYVLWDTYNNIKETEDFLNRWIEFYKEEYSFKWLICLKENNMPIGTITVVKMNKAYKTVGLGYAIGSKFWNNGYLTEALSELIKFFFEEVNVETVYAEHADLNVASGKVMMKCGMKLEGILRNRLTNKKTKEYMNLCSYSITKNDYITK